MANSGISTIQINLHHSKNISVKLSKNNDVNRISPNPRTLVKSSKGQSLVKRVIKAAVIIFRVNIVNKMKTYIVAKDIEATLYSSLAMAT